MNKKQVKELCGKDCKDMGIDLRSYPDVKDKLVQCFCCKAVVLDTEAMPTGGGKWACDRCWERGREVYEAMIEAREDAGFEE